MLFSRWILFVTVLAGVLCCCSGCATILGGIIGHQSGELAAGLAIGAAVDFGDNIINGVGQMLSDDQKEFRQHAMVDSEAGKITLPRRGFSVDRTKALLSDIQPRFEDAGWTHERIKLKTGFYVTNYTHSETWRCANSDGQPFELDIKMGWQKDSRLDIQIPPDSKADKSSVTLEIYGWLEDCVLGWDHSPDS